MKVDAEDFRRVYDSMNDETLLAVNRDELVEVARQCYDVEIARRGLTATAEAEIAAAPEDAGEREEMVEVATFTDMGDARLARALLKSAEIPCYVENDAALPGNLISNPGLGGFRLSVPPSWLEQAREVLDTRISDEELAAQAEAAGELEGEGDETTEE